MKTLTLALVTLLTSAAARADGFICQSEQGDLNVKVFNKTTGGTRSAAVMVFSDPSISHGRKTIATFRDSTATLGNNGTSYFAQVDQENEETARGGELIAGTKLGFVDTLALHVYFSYNAPVADGEVVNGAVIVKKLNGQRVNVPVSCERYLKGE